VDEVDEARPGPRQLPEDPRRREQLGDAEHGGRQREPGLQVEGVAEDQLEPRARIRARRDNKLACDNPKRLRDEQAADERDEQVPGRALFGGGGGRRHRTIEPRPGAEFKVAVAGGPSYY